MTDIWSERAEAYRTSAIHASGEDLDLVVEWCAPGRGVTVLDVATGGGHVARRLREAGLQVVTLDPSPGMRADVLSAAEELPFADASFDVVVSFETLEHTGEHEAFLGEILDPRDHRVQLNSDHNKLLYST